MIAAQNILSGFWAGIAARGASETLIDATAGDGARVALSGDELIRAAAGLSAELTAGGVAPGQKVAAHLNNGIDLALLYLACLWGGQIVVPINPSLSDKIKDYIVKAACPNLLIVSDATPLPVDRGEVFNCDAPATLVALGLKREGTDHVTNARDLFSITYTSGTTGNPKGVCHSAYSHLANVLAFNALTGLSGETRMLHLLPMAYMAGYHNTILSPLAAGGAVVLAPEFKGIAGIKMWGVAQRENINTAWMSPTILSFVLRATRDAADREWAAENLKNLFVGTAALPEATKAKFEETFQIKTLESYGMTEVLYVSANTHLKPSASHNVGHVLDGVDLDFKDGNMWIQSDHAFLGYFDPESQAPQMPDTFVDGWMDTGDIAELDDEGSLHIVGRNKDLIVRGGINISPRHVEEVLAHAPGLIESAVVGMPHPFWGEEVAAFVVMDETADGDVAETLTSYCTEHLNPDLIPKAFHVKNALPKTVTGKCDKKVLKQELANLAN